MEMGLWPIFKAHLYSGPEISLQDVYSSLSHVNYTHLYQRLVTVSSYYYHILYLRASTQVAGRGSGSSIFVWSRGCMVCSLSNQGVAGTLTLLENLL